MNRFGIKKFHEKCITIRFGIRIKNTDIRDNVTLVLCTRMDGTLTGNYMLFHTLMENLKFKVDLGSIPLYELEKQLHRCS